MNAKKSSKLFLNGYLPILMNNKLNHKFNFLKIVSFDFLQRRSSVTSWRGRNFEWYFVIYGVRKDTVGRVSILNKMVIKPSTSYETREAEE